MVDPEPDAVNAPPASENYCDRLANSFVPVDPEPEAINAPPASENYCDKLADNGNATASIMRSMVVHVVDPNKTRG